MCVFLASYQPTSHCMVCLVKWYYWEGKWDSKESIGELFSFSSFLGGLRILSGKGKEKRRSAIRGRVKGEGDVEGEGEGGWERFFY